MTRSTGSTFVTAMVAGNFAATLWHLHILRNMPGMESPGEILRLALIVGSASFVAILLIWSRFYRLGAWLSGALLLVGLVIGSDEHFFAANPNNVFTMPHGEWTLAFQVSCVLLVVVELAGIWASVRTATVRA